MKNSSTFLLTGIINDIKEDNEERKNKRIS
jgi:hypothetical protein